ncbi:hypothetical protein PV325_011782, partial [Microctonus aethiopoides]
MIYNPDSLTGGKKTDWVLLEYKAISPLANCEHRSCTVRSPSALGSRTKHVRCLPRVVAQWATKKIFKDPRIQEKIQKSKKGSEDPRIQERIHGSPDPSPNSPDPSPIPPIHPRSPPFHPPIPPRFPQILGSGDGSGESGEGFKKGSRDPKKDPGIQERIGGRIQERIQRFKKGSKDPRIQGSPLIPSILRINFDGINDDGMNNHSSSYMIIDCISRHFG